MADKPRTATEILENWARAEHGQEWKDLQQSAKNMTDEILASMRKEIYRILKEHEKETENN